MRNGDVTAIEHDHVAHADRRLAEAARLGFTRAIVPSHAPDPPAGMTAIRVGTLVEALLAIGITASGRNASRSARPSAVEEEATVLSIVELFGDGVRGDDGDRTRGPDTPDDGPAVG
ncbi:MAG: hypothetical protein B7C55_10330 [Actinomycetales bacterium mxb001]|nr:MAG: hypothetical protein B7C55_10330 [Actinomycetales bacterium mxb001]